MRVVEQAPFCVPVLMAVTVRAQAHKGTPDVLVIAHPGIGLDGARLYGQRQPLGLVGMPILM
jgi:hypothetical protein